MTTIYYVDYEGEAGTGDGSSFANRAKSFAALNNNTQYLSDGDHEVRVKKSPKKDLGSGSVRRRGGWFRQGYDGPEVTSNSSYWEFSTTTGNTQYRYDNHGLETGDWIEIWGNKWYFTDAAYGDGSGNQVMENLLGLNGLWQVTCPDGNWIKLDQYTGHMNSATSDSWSTRKINTSTNGKWYDVTASTVAFPSNNPLPLKAICSTGMGNRVKWTAASNVTTYDPFWTPSSWSNNSYIAAMGAADKFVIDNSVSSGTKCAHFELPATLDLSSYQGVTFELSWEGGNNSAWEGASTSNPNGQFSLRLCTDTAGATTAHTVPIDTRYINKTNARGHVEWELSSGNLNSAIKSVAIYKDGSVNTSCTFGIANVTAYKTGADRLNHNYKIGLNTTDDPWWYTIRGFEVARNAIRLNTSGGYYHMMREEFGYYGGILSCKWSADKTNVNIYSMKSYYAAEPCNGHDGTSGFYQGQNNNALDGRGRIEWKRFGNGVSESNLKKISGGWDDTNMTTQGATDLTWFDQRHGNAGYGGFYYHNQDNGSQGSRFQHIDKFGFSMANTYFGGRKGKYTKLHVDNPYYIHLGMHEPVSLGMEQITFATQQTTLIGNSQQGQRSESNKADNYITYWGGDGQEQVNLGHATGVWSKLDFEGCFRLKFPSDSNYNTPTYDNITVDFLKTGMHGRDSQGVLAEYIKSLVIKDWHSVYNYFTITNNAEVTIHDMTFDAGTQYTGIHGNASRSSYCINWNSPNINLLGGTTNRRIYIYKNAKIAGFTSTDSEEHYVTNENIEVLLANVNGVAGAGKYIRQGWYMEPETTIRHTASGKAWKITKTQSGTKPVYKLAKVAVAGSGTVTVKLWIYRVTSGTSSYGILRINADSTLGITSKIEMNSTNGAANTWYEATVTANPTSAGILDVEFQFEDSTNGAFIYFDDMTITQT